MQPEALTKFGVALVQGAALVALVTTVAIFLGIQLDVTAIGIGTAAVTLVAAAASFTAAAILRRRTD